MKERQKHRDAFEEWLKLGAQPTDANARKVAGKCKVHESTFWRWYKEFNWKERAVQRLLRINEKTEAKNDNSIADANALMVSDIDQYMRMIKQSFSKALVKNKEGKMVIEIKPESARDINYLVQSWDKLANRRSILTGQPGSRDEHNGKLRIEFIGVEDGYFTINTTGRDDTDKAGVAGTEEGSEG